MGQSQRKRPLVNPTIHPLDAVSEMIADDVRARQREAAERAAAVVAWQLPTAKPTVYCVRCVDATQAQRDRWKPLCVGHRWPAACQLCGRWGVS